MKAPTEDAWIGVQKDCDHCAVCRTEPALDTTERPPSRPWWPEQKGRLVFISEAPPPTGGFWATGAYDDLRQHLFCIIQGLGYRFPNDLHGIPALRVFMDLNLFLLQAVKWPLAKGQRRRRPNFNALGPRVQAALIRHTSDVHLASELALLEPTAVLAMGTAAWRACASLIPGRPPDVRVGDARGQAFVMAVGNRSLPLDVTMLPVDQNMRRVEGAALIREDIAKFMNRRCLRS